MGEPVQAPQASSANRVIYVGDLKNGAAQPIILALMGFDMESHNPIRVIVNSYGGFIDEMFAIYDVMKACESPIATIGVGKIMSAGVLLLAAGQEGERRIARNALVMLHELSSATWGKLFAIEADVEQMRRDQKRMMSALAMECRCTLTQVRDILETHRDTYLTAAEAKAFGIVDKVI